MRTVSKFGAALLLCLSASAQTTSTYTVTRLVTNTKDSNLLNPWGLSRLGKTSPDAYWWASDQVAGVSTLYDAKGVNPGLTVTIPPAAGGTVGSPTGTVANNGNFIFVTLDGTISQWLANSAPIKPGTACAECHVTTSTVMVDNSSKKASYQGITLATNAGVPTYYVANNSGGVETYSTSFTPIALASGAFTDPKIPATYAPAGIQAIGSEIYVTYNRIAGGGKGFVDVYTTAGVLKHRLQTGWFDQPWGVALAPKTFGQFAGDILIGNTGSGWIGAYSRRTGKFAGFLQDSKTGYDVTVAGLWAIAFGAGNADTGSASSLYFAGGGRSQKTGVFGKITLFK